MTLTEYRRKRDFTRTAEPRGRPRRSKKKLAFVIHKHRARRLHYDLRLEWDGVLKSWAVPKGPSLDPTVRSLAVQVEDHPLEYGEFEGDIPEGEYGAGQVIVWDRGQWIPQGNPTDGLRRGKLEFSLEGEKLKGSYHLVRMKPRDDGEDKNWLLFKSNDAYARNKSEFDVTAERPESVASGREIEDSGASKKPARRPKVRPPRQRSAPPKAKPDPSKFPNAKAARQPDWLAPQLAKLVTDAPDGDAWVHEIKYDGYRIMAVRDGARVRLLTRNKKDWTANFRRIAEAVARLPVSQAILDGEVCVLDAAGRSDFQALQNAMQTDTTGRMFYFVFDLPFLDGFDLRECPLTQRKDMLAAILSDDDTIPLLRFSEHLRGEGPRTLEEVRRLGLEGIISKRADSRYESRRSSSWLKVKCISEQEFVIGGYTDPQGGRKGFGALLLGVHDAKKGLVYCGRVGTGFDARLLETMTAQLKPLEVKAPPFSNPPTGADARGVHWTKPTLVAQVKFQSMTADGIVRHPVFGGLRADKPPSEVLREAPLESVRGSPSREKKGHRKPNPGRNRKGVETAGDVALSNPQRVLFAQFSTTKADLAAYYEKVGDLILPYLADRPLMLVRCPNGVEGKCFHQKHPARPIPATLRGVPIREEKKTETYLVVDEARGLTALVQMNAVEIHTWGSRARNLEHPDRVIFDLDPGPTVAWPALIDAARMVRGLLEELGLESYVKTSGGKGLHVVVPLRPSANWDQTKEFARVIATGIAHSDPARFAGKMTKSLRQGKIYIDYLRNGRGATCVEAFSTRAKPNAPVSLPLSWRELAGVSSSDEFTVQDVGTWLRMAKKAWAGYFEKPPALTSTILKKLGIR